MQRFLDELGRNVGLAVIYFRPLWGRGRLTAALVESEDRAPIKLKTRLVARTKPRLADPLPVSASLHHHPRNTVAVLRGSSRQRQSFPDIFSPGSAWPQAIAARVLVGHSRVAPDVAGRAGEQAGEPRAERICFLRSTVNMGRAHHGNRQGA